MAKQRYLKNAPIREAVIDLRITPPLDLSALSEIPSSVREEIKNRYPKMEEQRSFEGGFGIKDGQPIVRQPVDLGVRGYIFESSDEPQRAQFRRDGFTFNRLKPYTCWESVIAEAKELWNIYLRSASPQSVSRIAVRYINHLSIPLPISDFKDFLTAPPPIPESAPQVVSSFSTRVVVHDIERQLYANIAQAMEGSTKPNFVTIIIDIDAYRSGEFDAHTEEIWLIMDQLRHLKNTIFFGSITEKTARLFE